MRFPLGLVFGLFASLTCDSVFAQGILPRDRRPVHGIPRIGERYIPQFVLLKDVLVDQGREPSSFMRMSVIRAIPKNLFVPVSEDKEGVFYHAQNGLLEKDWDSAGNFVPGGLYVSKTKPGVIFGYFGDARKSGWILRLTEWPLTTDVLQHLKISEPIGRHQNPRSKKQHNR